MNNKLQEIQEINDIGIQGALLYNLACFCNGKLTEEKVQEMRDILVQMRNVPTTSDMYSIAKYTGDSLFNAIRFCETKDKKYIKLVEQAAGLQGAASYALQFKMALEDD